MPIATTCPNCKALFRLADDMAGEKVKCQKCQHIFVVPNADEKTMAPGVSVMKPPIDMEVDREPTAAPRALAAPPIEEEVFEGRAEPERPSRRRAPPPRDDRDDDRPVRRRPRRAPRGSGSGTTALVVLLLGGGLVGCIGCLGVGGILAYNANKPVPVAKKEKAKIDVKVDENGKRDEPPQGKGPAGTIEVALGADGKYRDNNVLNQFDRVEFGKRKKLYSVHMVQGSTYQIDLASDDFDSYLYLYDDRNQLLLQDDDGGGRPDARILFRAPRTGFYVIHATHFRNNPEQGDYSLFVRRTVNGEIVIPQFP